MINVTIHDLDPEKVFYIMRGLECANVDDLERKSAEDGNYDISFDCKNACYIKSPHSYKLIINHLAMELNRKDFSFIAIS